MREQMPTDPSDLVTPVVLRVALGIGLLDQARDAPATTADLAGRLSVDPDVLARLVRFLEAREVLTVDESGVVRTTRIGHTLRERSDRYRARLDWTGAAGWLDRRFVLRCLPAVRGERPPTDVWEALDRDPALSDSFDDLMAARAGEWIGGVVADRGWADVRQVADVGGGRGHLLSALLTAWPHLRGMLIERSATAESARRAFARSGLDHRVEVLAADIRSGIPGGCDVYLLAHVLHDWDDDTAGLILGHAAAAAGAPGRVVVVEREIGGRTALETTAQDLRMLVLFGGRERGLADFDRLARRAGLSRRARRRLTAGRSMLTFHDRTGHLDHSTSNGGRHDG